MADSSSEMTKVTRTYGNVRNSFCNKKALVNQCESFQLSGMLRATPIGTVLHAFGAILRCSAGDDTTYELSLPTQDELHCFLSHNWAVGRFPKFFAWSLHFNSNRALLASMAVLCVACVLTSFGCLPTMETPMGRCGITCWAATTPVFLLVLVFGHEIEYFLGSNRSLVFLDKTCIHQTNPVLKQRGIAKLGAFIANSRDMVVCYSDEYLNRLWTVYELGCFLAVHHMRSVILIPVSLPPFMISLQLVIYGTQLASRYYGTGAIKTFLLQSLLVCVVNRIALTVLLKQQEIMHKAVQKFKFGEAKCFCEGDRQLVQRNIHETLRVSKMIPPDATESEALQAFDDMVKARVPGYLAQSIGCIGVPYRFILMVLATARLPSEIDFWSVALAEQDFRTNLLQLLDPVLRTLTLEPFWYALESTMIRRCLRLSGKKSVFFALFLTYPLSYSVLCLLCLLSTELAGKGETSDLHAALFAILHVCASFGTFWAYRHFGRPPMPKDPMEPRSSETRHSETPEVPRKDPSEWSEVPGELDVMHMLTTSSADVDADQDSYIANMIESPSYPKIVSL